jgi:hypothetical protein
MTREESIAILDGFKHNPLFNQQHFEALDMAISALSAEGDLISRQAVIDAIQKLNIPEDMCVFEIISHIEVAIATLPSVESNADMREPKKSCTTCVNNDDELSGECYECVKGIFDHYEPREADFPQAEDIEPTVERFKNTMDRFDDLLSDADMRGE